MSTQRKLFNALAFQGGWFACVIGGTAWALAAAAIFLPIHLALCGTPRREAALMLICASLGVTLDLTWQNAGLLSFGGAAIGPLPVWLLMLWLLFAATLGQSLSWLQGRLRLAALLGAVFGPASYCAGLALGAAQTGLAHWQVALAMAPAWMALLPLLLWIHKRGIDS